MATKRAGLNAAGAVLLAVLGLIVLIGVILLMMWAQPGIQHSPSEQGRLNLSGPTARLSLRLQSSFEPVSYDTSYIPRSEA